MKAVRLSALRTCRLYPSGDILGTLSVRGWVDPRVIVRPEELRQWPHWESNLRLSRRYIPEDSNLQSRACSLIRVKLEIRCQCADIWILSEMRADVLGILAVSPSAYRVRGRWNELLWQNSYHRHETIGQTEQSCTKYWRVVMCFAKDVDGRNFEQI